MTRVLAVGLTIVLLVAVPATAAFAATPVGSGTPTTGADVAASVPAPVDGLDTPARLSLPAADEIESGTNHPTIHLSATLDTDSHGLDSQYREYRLGERLDAATSEAERRAILRETASRLDENVTALRDNEQNAYTAYANGEYSERELLVVLAKTHVKAETLEQSIAELERQADTVPASALSDDIATMETETETMQGPVRGHTADVLRGETESTRTHVEASENGVVLATIDDGEFVREVYHTDNRDPAAEDELGFTEGFDRLEEMYGYISEDVSWRFGEFGSTAIYRGVATHPQGVLYAYLDGGTGDVFREHQTLQLDRVPTTEAGTVADDGLQMTVNRTYPGGPARITLTDAGTGDPIRGDLTVNDEAVGRTDSDGERWIVAPRNSTTVRATVGADTVETTVEWSASGDASSPALWTAEGS